MAFNITPNVKVRRDKEGKVRNIEHLQEPYLPEDNFEQASCQALASGYLSKLIPILEIPKNTLNNLAEGPLSTIDLKLGNELRLVQEKRIMANTTLEYAQTHFGLPIWHSGVSVSVHHEPLRTTSTVSTLKYNVKIENTAKDDQIDFAGNLDKMTSDDKLVSIVGIDAKKLKGTAKKDKESYGKVKINGRRLIIYQYDPENRLAHNHDDNTPLEGTSPSLPILPVDKSIKRFAYYVVQEIHFNLPVSGGENYNWRVFIEPRTNSVLYLRPLVDNATGYIYTIDPLTKTGDNTILPSSSNAVLNPLRDLETLDGINAPGDQLEGEYVEVVNVSAPNPTIPTEATGNFLYNVRTDDFNAVSAYYHCDRLFRMLDGMGFDLNTYFDGTTFPVRVDHRATINGSSTSVNASAPGNGLGNGSDGFRFTLLQSGSAVGMAASWRVTLHEFGHTILWDHVNSPNFGFAHSCGDSLAAILGDPNSLAPDRFESFPWVTLGTPGVDRRHDRSIAAGWAWGGNNDIGGYSSETILSTTLFRAYQSCGGDHSSQNVREFAARYMAFLIFSAVGTLTPATNPNDPEDFALALLNADLGTVDFEGHPGGAFHKVVRWAFEKQGSYQPVGAPSPVSVQGDPPDVDVYIDDGRNGEYPFQQNFWNTTDMWNRLAADSGVAHETPVVGVTNYMYVRVQNRGTQTANNVEVKAFHNIPSVGLIWPDSWQPMTTVQLPGGSITSGGATIVGPFEWTPAIAGHECLLAVVEATGDPSNTNNINGAQTIPHWRLVPFDNNIAQRNVAPVPGGGGSFELSSAFRRRKFWFKNPYSFPGAGVLTPRLPAFLVKKGWEVKFLNAGGNRFSLGAKEQQEIVFTLNPGEDFTEAELNGVQDFTIEAYLNDLPIGGMTYHIDPKIKKVPNEVPGEEKGDCIDNAKHLLDCLDIDIPESKVKNVCIKKISIDIELDNDCC